ncbi:hypothetical protein Trydic_g13362 [Trypoxylus dichotomus]
MALPSALAAKLSKRGLIADTNKKPEVTTHKNYKGVIGCPNKNNIYHECTNWCQIHWKGVIIPDPRYSRNVKRMLEKYPLPNNWTEVFDKGIGRYYYWNMETDVVSWLPPKHPKAIPTECTAKLRMRLHQPRRESGPDRDRDRRRDHRDRHHRDKRDRDRRDDDKRRHDDNDRGRRKPKNDDLDPMDPSAYSDIPRGTWSDGLENKSKADVTASGALYQQRPYPSPGDVLNENKKLKRY